MAGRGSQRTQVCVDNSAQARERNHARTGEHEHCADELVPISSGHPCALPEPSFSCMPRRTTRHRGGFVPPVWFGLRRRRRRTFDKPRDTSLPAGRYTEMNSA